MLISVITVSNRPAYLDHVIANFQRQRWPQKELVFVANSADFDLEMVRRRLDQSAPNRVIAMDTTIGAAMNQAIGSSSGEAWAKLDDDDEYGPDYLVEAANALRDHGAALVGKRSCYGYLSGSDTTILRNPGREHGWVGSVVGATLVGHKARLAGYVWPDEYPTGEDTRFILSFTADGNKIWSTGRSGFMFVRRADPGTHTWQIDDATLSRNAEIMGPGMLLRLAGCR